MADEMTPDTTATEEQTTQEEGSTLLTSPEQQEPDTKVEQTEEKPAEEAKDEKKDEGKDGLPETYEIKLQDGFVMTEDDQKQVDTMFKELGLNTEQGQRLADYYMSRFKAQQDQVTEAYQKQQEAEVEAVKADKEIGGSALNEQLGYARQAMDRFGGETFRKELEAHGMGNNPEMIRLLARVGRAIQGDTLVVGTNGGQSKDAAHILYPNMK